MTSFSGESIKSFEPKGWLTNDAIDAACLYLFRVNVATISTNMCFKGSYASVFWWGHYSLYKTMAGYDYAINCRVIERNDCIDISVLQSYDILIVPFHVPSHWLLFIVHLKEKTIEIYDSL